MYEVKKVLFFLSNTSPFLKKKIKFCSIFVQILFCVRYTQVKLSFGAEKNVRYVQCPLLLLLLLLSLSFNSVSLQKKKEVATTLAGLFKPNI